MNVQACGCDLLYRTITIFSFLLFQSDGLYTTVKLRFNMCSFIT